MATAKTDQIIAIGSPEGTNKEFIEQGIDPRLEVVLDLNTWKILLKIMGRHHDGIDKSLAIYHLQRDNIKGFIAKKHKIITDSIYNYDARIVGELDIIEHFRSLEPPKINGVREMQGIPVFHSLEEEANLLNTGLVPVSYTHLTLPTICSV